MSTTEIIALALVKYGPALARALLELFKVDVPTDEDWNRVFALAQKSYDEYVKPNP